jgi:hypothetical protein
LPEVIRPNELRFDYEITVMVNESVFAVLYYYQRFTFVSSKTNNGRNNAEKKRADYRGRLVRKE